MHGTLHARNTATPSTSLTYLHGAWSSVNSSMNWSTTEPEGSSSLLPSHEVKQFNSVQFLCLERVSVHPVYAQHYPQSNGELPTKTLKALTPFPFMLHVPSIALSWFYSCGSFMARYCRILVSTVRIINCKGLWRKLSWSTRDANPAFPWIKKTQSHSRNGWKADEATRTSRIHVYSASPARFTSS